MEDKSLDVEWESIDDLLLHLKVPITYTPMKLIKYLSNKMLIGGKVRRLYRGDKRFFYVRKELIPLCTKKIQEVLGTEASPKPRKSFIHKKRIDDKFLKIDKLIAFYQLN